MKLDEDLLRGTFLERPNRFLISVRADRKTLLAHLPNSGRLATVLTPGVELLLRQVPAGSRKTVFDVVLARPGGGEFVSVDARLPPALLREAIESGAVEGLDGYEVQSAEPALGGGRFDLLLKREGRPLIVETKSVTLVEGERALFPDSPTLRGRRHVEEAVKSRGSGVLAAIVFVV